MEEIFRSGTLEMSTRPIPGLAEGLAWSDILTNRILASLAVFLMIIGLLDLFRLAPHLLYSFDRSRGGAALEHSVSLARTRNTTALIHLLPFCLLADRFKLFRPDFWQHIPAEWSAPATIGVAVLFLLVRSLCYALFRPPRLGPEEQATLRHNPYNYFILLTVLMLVTAAVLILLHVPETAVRTVLLWECGILTFAALLRSAHFLGSNGLGFTTFLYLCGLEIIPLTLLVAIVLFF
ncbi:MAG: hypothetical protein K5910_08965 [Bacteroidales bacterium]|nr:hypothetical protein [Bacteroidales bacterium]